MQIEQLLLNMSHFVKAIQERIYMGFIIRLGTS